jgi:phosphoglycolate phosphatase-like HAD superfamily hydrolase
VGLLASCVAFGCLPEILPEALRGDGTPAEAITETVRRDPLPSWNERSQKRAILDFVERVTEAEGPDYVPPENRIAVFDNDGTLLGEQPMYVELAFALDRIHVLAPVHPQWRERPALAAAIDGDLEALAAAGQQGAAELLAATHAGMTTEDFERTVHDWIETARHPKLGVRYPDLAYQPMLEVLRYLDARGFKIFIVSGGGVEFMRPWAEKLYGVPRERIIGSRGKLKYEPRDGKPAIVKEPEIELVDDGSGKPVGIQERIGRRPILAFGNSDGDFQMLEWTTSQAGPHLGVLVHHTDGDREWAYDRESKIGKLSRGLDEAGARGWLVVDMKKDWSTIYAGR